MKKIISAICFLLAVLLIACGKDANTNMLPAPTIPSSPLTNTNFVKGADMSWITQMEASNIKFYGATGMQTEGMALLKSIGMNTIRLRVWVNPTDGWCNTADMVAKAMRANALGMRILLDIHYSDSWADPGKQTKPAAWATQDISALQTSVYNYTVTLMNALKAQNITPEWVQVGNETNDGMLWPEGRASTNMANFAKLITSGYTAVKSVSTTSKVIVHISNGYDNNLFRYVFDGLKTNGAKWDIIGMSLYPTAANWSTLNTQCLANMNDMVTRYATPVMIVEVGMSVTDASACNSFIADLIAKTRSIPNNQGLGVIYWEPQSYNNWQGYTLGAFDNTGKPTVALNAFTN